MRKQFTDEEIEGSLVWQLRAVHRLSKEEADEFVWSLAEDHPAARDKFKLAEELGIWRTAQYELEKEKSDARKAPA